MVDDAEVVQNLKRDLQDGEDLSMAVSLVSDAVQRRIRRVQRSLDQLDPDGDDSAALHRRMRRVLERYEAALEDQSRGLEQIIDTFQPELGELADDLAEEQAPETGGDT